LQLVACRDPGNSDADASGGGGGGPDADSAYPAPRTDLVPSVGSESTFEMATWNVENFPKVQNTAKVLADLIASMDVDMVVMEELQDTVAFDELVERLRGYEGLYSSHTYSDGSYQKIGYIYRTGLVSVSGAFLLFTDNGYEFPRPALKLDVFVSGDNPLSFTSIGLHLKAGGGFTDRSRREDAVVILENFLRTAVDNTSEDRIAVLGDWNDTLDNGANVFAPITSAPDRYDIRTTGNEAAGDISFVPSSVLLDHIVTTSAFDTAFGTGTTVIPRLDMQISGYESQVSDHLPVVMRLPL